MYVDSDESTEGDSLLFGQFTPHKCYDVIQLLVQYVVIVLQEIIKVPIRKKPTFIHGSLTIEGYAILVNAID